MSVNPKNLNVDYRQLLKGTNFKTPALGAGAAMSSLTPSELASSFPEYYKRILAGKTSGVSPGRPGTSSTASPTGTSGIPEKAGTEGKTASRGDQATSRDVSPHTEIDRTRARDNNTPEKEPIKTIPGSTPLGPDTSKFTNDKITTKISPGGHPVVAANREKAFEELDNNPALKNKVAALMLKENDKHPEGPGEALFNRQGATGESINSLVHGKKGKKGFYGPINRGEVTDNTWDRLSKADKEKAMAALERVRGGSMDIGGRTDQGLINEHAAADKDPALSKVKINGEYYSFMNRDHLKKSQQIDRQIKEYDAKLAKQTSEPQKEVKNATLKTNEDPGKLDRGLFAPERIGGETNRQSASPVASSGNLVDERQKAVAGTRKQELSSRLKDQLNYAADKSGVKVEVYSGGQPKIGTPGAARVGSTRHDDGNAADLKLYVEDDKGKRRYLDMNDPNDKKIMSKFVTHAAEAGATGIGAGNGYMGSKSIHVGGGSEATWGGANWVGPAHEQGRKMSQNFNLEKWKEARSAEQAARANITEGKKPYEEGIGPFKGAPKAAKTDFITPTPNTMEGAPTVKTVKVGPGESPLAALPGPTASATQMTPQPMTPTSGVQNTQGPGQSAFPTGSPDVASIGEPTAKEITPVTELDEVVVDSDAEANAYGGKIKNITAVPLKDQLRNTGGREDTAIVADNKVKAYINKKEGLSINPKTNSMDITPTQRVDAEAKKDADKTAPKSPPQNRSGIHSNESMMNAVKHSAINPATSNWGNMSVERAYSRNKFFEPGDIISGYHFNAGAVNFRTT
jgi:hypothetical protein